MDATVNSLGAAINFTVGLGSVPETELSEVFAKAAVPFMIVCGILGNMMSIWVFHAQLSRKSSFNLYLLARSMTDTGVLFAIFVAWLDTIDVRWFNTEGICQITVCVSYIFSFLSVWFVSYAALENYIRMCCHDKVSIYCNDKTARRVIIITVSVSIVMYNFPLWTATVENIDDEDHCQPNSRFYIFLVVAVYLDTLCTFLIPLIIILLSMCAVITSSYRIYKWRSKMRHSRPNGTRDTTPHAKATQFLMGVSLSFLLLHTPSHVYRIRMMILSTYQGSLEIHSFDQIDRDLKKYFEIVYYFNFSINFFIYLACGKTFRTVLCSKLRKISLFLNKTQQNSSNSEIIPDTFNMT